MTVRELIKQLQEHDGDELVVIEACEKDFLSGRIVRRLVCTTYYGPPDGPRSNWPRLAVGIRSE